MADGTRRANPGLGHRQSVTWAGKSRVSLCVERMEDVYDVLTRDLRRREATSEELDQEAFHDGSPSRLGRTDVGQRQRPSIAPWGMFWSNEDGASGMRRQSVGDTAKQSATENAPAPLTAHDQACGEVVRYLQDGLGNPFERLPGHWRGFISVLPPPEGTFFRD